MLPWFEQEKLKLNETLFGVNNRRPELKFKYESYKDCWTSVNLSFVISIES